MPTSAATIDPAALPWYDEPERQKPVPMSSLVASAKRLTSQTIESARHIGNQTEWQKDAWDMYDLVGEQRFLATTLAGRMGQARFYVGQRKEPHEQEERQDGKERVDTLNPDETDNEEVRDIFKMVGGGPTGFAQLITRMGINLFVAGDGYLVGIPKHLLPDEHDNEDGQPAPSNRLTPTSPMPEQAETSIPMEDLEWRMLSTSEVSVSGANELKLSLGEVSGAAVVVDPDEVFLIRVWRPHPRKWWESDSPTRSSLPVLRELVGLTMHISAQIDSRLAGAGLLLVPQSAERALKESAGMDPNSEEDVFTEALMDAMMTPIKDRSNASAVVPLVSVVPDESAENFRHISFSSPLDSEARSLRDEAIRRLALGQDAPPELLLGVSSMNHWGAWLVREDVVTTHIEPHLALICDALTTQYLRPLLLEMGYDEEEVNKYEVWYDVSHMVSRPNRSSDAQTLHDKGVLSDEALREANGFDENDAPDEPHLDQATRIALRLIESQPHLVERIDELVAKLRVVVADGLRHGEMEDEDGTPLPDDEEVEEAVSTAAEREADQTDPIDEVPDQDAERPATENSPGIEASAAFPNPYNGTLSKKLKETHPYGR